MSRWILRLFLVLLLVAAVWVAYRSWQRRTPAYHWRQAQEAVTAGDMATARIHLLNLLRLSPGHGPGHVALADVDMQLAAQPNTPQRVSAETEALAHLGVAARLMPDDLVLQKRFLAALLSQRRMAEAVAPAERVLKSDPNNADALFTIVWQAVRTRSDRAPELFQKLRQVPSSRVMQTLAMAADYFSYKAQIAELQEVLSAAVQLAATTDRDGFALLTKEDLRILPDLLQLAVAQSPDAEVAIERTSQGLAACETLSAEGGQSLADYAGLATRLELALQARFPQSASESPDHAKRVEISEAVRALQSRAMEAGLAPPWLYAQAALSALADNRCEDAETLAARGLELPAEAPVAKSQDAARLHLIAAKAALLAGRVESARPHVEAVLGNDAYGGWAHLMSAAMQYRDGFYERAMKQLKLAERALGRCYEVCLLTARCQLALRQWDPSLQYLSLARKADFARIDLQPWTRAARITDPEMNWLELQARLGKADWQAAQTLLPTLHGTQWDAPARAACAASLWRDKHPEQAQQILDTARTTLPHDLELVRVQADLWAGQGREDDALALVQQAAAAQSESLPHQLLHALWLKRVRGNAAAIACLEPLLAQFPQHAEPRLMLAELLLDQGDLTRALELLSEAGSNAQTADWGHLLAASALQKSNDPAGASARLQKLSGRSPNTPAIGLLQGELALARGDVAQAVEQFAESLDVGRLRSLAANLTIRAVVQLIDGQGAAEAESILKELTDRRPGDPMLWLLQAECCFRQGATDRGFAALDRAEQLQPGEPSGPFFKSLAHYRLGNLPAALHEAQRAVDKKLDFVPALVIGAKASFAIGQHQASLRLAQFAHQLDPQLWEMQLIAARSLSALGEQREAIALVNKVLEAKPDMQAAHVARIELLSTAGRWPDVLEACRAARGNVTEGLIVDVHQLNALLHLRQQQPASDVLASISSSSPSAAICLATGQVLAACGDLAAAVTWGQRALEQDAGDATTEVHMFLGELLTRLGQSEGEVERLQAARRHFEAVLEQEPGHLPAANNLAWLLAEPLAQPVDAVEVAVRAQGNRPVTDLPEYFVDTLATALRLSKRSAEGLILVDTGLETNPSSPSLLYQKGVLLAELGRHEEAHASLRAALQAGLSEPRRSDASERLEQAAREQAEQTQLQPARND